MQTVMEKERLAAFVDGVLSPEESAAIVLHLADHPGDQAYVDDLFAANAALAQAFSAPMGEPVPEAIRATILGGAASAGASRVVPFRPRTTGYLWAAGGAALAAGLVAAAFLLGTSPADRGLAPGLLAAGDGLADMLDSRAAGVSVTLDDGRAAMVLASFALPDAGYCREIEVIDTRAARIDYGVACRESSGWAIRLALAEGMPDATATPGFTTASGAEAQALISLLDGGTAAVALDAGQEAEAMAKGWPSP